MTNPFYDRLINASRQDAASASVLILHSLQDYIEHANSAQVLATAAVFLLLCEKYGVAAQDAFRAATNLMNEHDGTLSREFSAVRAYLNNEVR